MSRAHRKANDRLQAMFSAGTTYERPTRLPAFNSTRLSRAVRLAGERLAYTTARAWGCLLLSFGILTVLLAFIEARLLTANVNTSEAIIGLVFCLVSIPFLLFDTSIYVLTRELPATNFLLFDFFCLPTRHKSENTAGIRPVLFVMIGVLLAAIGFFTSAAYTVLGMGLVLLVLLSLSAPEMPFFLTLLLFPYLPLFPHPSFVLAVLIGLSALSFIRKVLLGNRFFTLTPYELPLLLFGLVLIVSGIFHEGAASTYTSLLYGAFLFGFPLASNLITNRRLADAALSSIAFSSMPIAVYAIVQAIRGVPNGNWIDESFRGRLTDRVMATFGNPNIYAVFAMIALMLSLALAIEKKHPFKKGFYAVGTLLNATALVLTWSRGAWLATLLGLGVCALLRLRRHPGWIACALLFLPFLLRLLPTAVTERFLSIFRMTDSTVLYRLDIWRASLSMLRDHLFTGIGTGSDAFSSVLSAYAPGLTAPHSHSLLLQLAIEGGVFAVLFFLALLVLRVLHLRAFTRYIRLSSVYMPAMFSTAALFCVLLFGITDFPFTNPCMLYLFFVVFGMGSATLRIAKAEDADRALYRTAELGAEAAQADIDLERW